MVGEFIDFATGERGAVWNTDSFDTWLFEDLEIGVLEDCGEVDELETIAKIWLINTIGIHGEFIRKAWDGRTFDEVLFGGLGLEDEFLVAEVGN